ncbi:MAG TPA: histidine phosphatase family protein [Gaiellaceae bacterium]|nr:histidine phosphatase family protein [Gaiellaceae bacterium]
MATTILLVRHGETDWNRERRVQGHTDTPLNATGREQAAALAAALAGEPVAAVYASDLARARDTAQAVAQERGLEVRIDPDLREKHFGTWEGLYDHEVLERFPEAATGPWGDGETTEQMLERVLAALSEIASRHPGEQIVAVTHGGPLRAVLRQCAVDGVDSIANCHVARIAFREGKLERVD